MLLLLILLVALPTCIFTDEDVPLNPAMILSKYYNGDLVAPSTAEDVHLEPYRLAWDYLKPVMSVYRAQLDLETVVCLDRGSLGNSCRIGSKASLDGVSIVLDLFEDARSDGNYKEKWDILKFLVESADQDKSAMFSSTRITMIEEKVLKEI